MLVETNDASAAATLAEDVPMSVGSSQKTQKTDLYDTLDDVEPRVVVRSTGKSSVKSSRNPGLYPSDEVVSAGSSQRGDFSLSATGRSSRARSAPRRAPRPPPPKDLTVPVSPAITKTRVGSKRKNDRCFEEKTSEELDLERSLAAAAKEKAKRRRVENRAGDGAAGSTRVVATGVGRSTRATAKKKTSRENARVAFGGRVVAETAKKKENGPGSASVPTVPRSPNLRGASLRDRFAKKTPAKTSEALELERLAAVPKFRARPLKRGVLQGSAGAAEKAAAAAAKRREAAADAARVKPAPFDAAVGRARTRDERAAERAEMAARDAKRARAAVDAEPFGFAGAVPPTAPESPAFATARRAALRAPHEPPLEKGPAAATRGGAARGGVRRRRTSPFVRGHERRVRRVRARGRRDVPRAVRAGHGPAGRGGARGAGVSARAKGAARGAARARRSRRAPRAEDVVVAAALAASRARLQAPHRV